MRYFLYFCLLTTPSLVLAHTKWFARGELAPVSTTDSTGLFLTVGAIVALLIVAVGVWLDRAGWLQLNFLTQKKPHAFSRAASTFIMVVGAFLVIAGTHTYLFSPNLTPEAGIPLILIYIQIFLGFAFLLGLASRSSGLMLAVLWALQFPFVGFVATLENTWVLSTAIFITLLGNDYFAVTSFSLLRRVVSPLKHYALSILRIGTGLTLIILGLSEKIMAPEFGINFLAQHQWNFIAKIGLPFSDYLFTLSAGIVESLFGLLFLLGIATRLTALVVIIVFSIPIFFLGPIELAGHLPHLAAIFMLLLFGNGGHFLPLRPKTTAINSQDC